MTKIRLTKLEAARRQIDAAIRMTFANEDAVAIHSVVAAAHRIIRDICEARGDVESYLRFTDWIAPGHENEFWSAVNASANFIKHANKDAGGIHEMDEEVSDFMIVFASKWYRDLGNEPSDEMKIFTTWWTLQHPKTINPAMMEHLRQAGLPAATIQAVLTPLNRADRLKAGYLFLSRSRA